MRVIALYRPNSEFARQTEMFARDLEHSQGVKVELVNVDTREGTATATLYDAVQYPAIVVLAEDGHMQQMWQGSQLPLMSEVAGYAHA